RERSSMPRTSYEPSHPSTSPSASQHHEKQQRVSNRQSERLPPPLESFGLWSVIQISASNQGLLRATGLNDSMTSCTGRGHPEAGVRSGIAGPMEHWWSIDPLTMREVLGGRTPSARPRSLRSRRRAI